MNRRETKNPVGDRTGDAEIERDVPATIFRRCMFWTPEREAPSAWIEHVPFAFWLTDVLRPRMFVELGTHHGVSYSAVCQAVKSLGLSTACFAIDTWQGDEHSGFYSEDVYRDFAAFNDQRYSAFSRVVRSSFDEALRHFQDGSIDLLHIDGLHTYEAVRHDYLAWQPKLSSNAVVLFHDTNVRENRFGVFRLWSEIAEGKVHFSFLHGHGLGVLGVGWNYSDALFTLFKANHDEHLASSMREIFAGLGRAVRYAYERRELERSLSEHGERVGRLSLVVAAREQEIETFKASLVERESYIAELEQALEERDKLIEEREGQLAARDRSLEERDIQIKALDQSLAEREGESDALRSSIAARESEVRSLDATNSALYLSASWRVTAPLRTAGHLLRRLRYSRLGYALTLGWRALRVRSREPLRQLRDERIIASSGLFETDYYLKTNPDVAALGIDPIRHFVAFGAKEGRIPSSRFDAQRYLEQNRDVAARGVNPFLHYALSTGEVRDVKRRPRQLR